MAAIKALRDMFISGHVTRARATIRETSVATAGLIEIARHIVKKLPSLTAPLVIFVCFSSDILKNFLVAMLSLVRALLVLVSLFLVFHVSEAGLLRERLLGRSKMDDMYRGQSFDAKRFDEWLGKR